MKIAICDDESPIRNLIEKYVKEALPKAECVQFSSGDELIKNIKASDGNSFDILLLDIAMDGLDGMAVAGAMHQNALDKNISVRAAKPLIIFVTGMDDRMGEAFGVSAFEYITKPIDRDRFVEIMLSAAAEVRRLDSYHIASEKHAMAIQIKSGNSFISVSPTEIYLIESIGRKIIIHTRDKGMETYGKISEWEQNLGSAFFRIHKSYLVNMKYVKSYTRSEVTLSNGYNALLSKYRYSDFVSAYMDYLTDRRNAND